MKLSRGTCSSEAFRAGNRTDDAQMSATFSEEVGESAVHKPHEAVNVGCNGVQFCTGIEINVLATDAGAVNVQVHSAQISDQSKQVAGGIVRAHVNAACMDFLGRFGLDFLETLGASARNAEFPAFGK